MNILHGFKFQTMKVSRNRDRAPILVVVSRNSLQFQIRDLRQTERQTYLKFENNDQKNINFYLSLCPELLDG